MYRMKNVISIILVFLILLPNVVTFAENFDDGNNIIEQDKLEQDKLEQDKLEQDKLEQDKLEQDKLEQDKLEQDKPEQDKLEQDKLEQDKPEQDKPEQDKLEQDKLEQDKSEQDKPEQDKSEQDKLEQDKPEQNSMDIEIEEIYPELKNMKVLFSDGVVEVSNWNDFLLAYNDSNVRRIELKADIETYSIKGLQERKNPLIIYGDKSDYKTKDQPYYKLELHENELPLGNSVEDFQEFKLENLEISNKFKSDNTIRGGFLDVKNDDTNRSIWTLHFKNIKNSKKRTNPKYADMMRFAVARSSIFIFEGEIDVEMYLEYALPGKVIIKEGTRFKGNQHNESNSNGGAWQHSAFWYHTSSAFSKSDRTFKVEDNVEIEWSRTRTSNYPPIYAYYSSIEVGNNVNWYQDNYKYFLSNSTSPSNKDIKFGAKNKIKAVRSSDESIDFKRTSTSNIEFGPGSSIVIEGNKSVITVGRNAELIFRNPVGLELESKAQELFSLDKDSSVEFKYVTMNVWKDNPQPDQKPDKTFKKVKSAKAINSTIKSVEMKSDDKNLVDYFKTVNPRKITTEKVPVGDIELNYINYKTGKTIEKK